MLGERGERKLWKGKERRGEAIVFERKFFAGSSSKTTPPKLGLIEIPSSFPSFPSLSLSLQHVYHTSIRWFGETLATTILQ